VGLSLINAKLILACGFSPGYNAAAQDLAGHDTLRSAFFFRHDHSMLT
jgi:hypothetical protein